MSKPVIDQLCSMNMNRREGHTSPHKAVMMLAVIDLIASDGAKQNRVCYGPELLEHFRRYFDIVKTPKDAFSPLLPFFYLRGESFWHHQPVEGQETIYDAIVVKQAYHFQCAACGLRIVFDAASLVDAAHIILFAESHDDDPYNGLSLCKNHHWAMDQELIFPCSDNCWHVNKGIDDRIDGQRALIDLHGKPLISPIERKFFPKQTALLWREQRLKAQRKY